MVYKKWCVIIITLVIIIVASTVLLYKDEERSNVNLYGYEITEKDAQLVLSDMTAYYEAISEHNVQEMVKYTINNENEERIRYLENEFKKEFDLILNELEIIYDYPAYPKGDFDNKKINDRYNVEKAVVIKAKFTIQSNEVYGLLGFDVGNHEFFLCVVKTKEEDHWQLAGMSNIDPFREE